MENRSKSSASQRTPSIADSHEDELRRKKEMNLFASFALGGEESIDGFDDTKGKESPGTRRQHGAAFDIERKSSALDKVNKVESPKEENTSIINRNASSRKQKINKIFVPSSDFEWNNFSDKDIAASTNVVSKENKLSQADNTFLNQIGESHSDNAAIKSYVSPKASENINNNNSRAYVDDGADDNVNDNFKKIAHNDAKSDTFVFSSPKEPIIDPQSVWPYESVGPGKGGSPPFDAWIESGNKTHTVNEVEQPYLIKMTSQPPSVEQNDDREMFLTGTRQDADSGTFNFTPSKQSKLPGPSEQANLDAAVAALSKTDADPSNVAAARRNIRQVSLPKPLVELEQQQQRKATSEQLAMFSEEILMPRPLFFGAIIPPRILKEAKDMVRDAVERYNEDQHRLISLASPTTSPTKSYSSKPLPPRLYELPVEVRNMVGALRTYGFGLLAEVVTDLEVKSPEKEGVKAKFAASLTNYSAETASESLKCFGNPYVSTFQPVWGSYVRDERLKSYRKQQKKHLRRPKQLTGSDRSATAPARLPILSLSDEDECDDEEDFEVDNTLLKYVSDNAENSSPLKYAEGPAGLKDQRKTTQSATFNESNQGQTPSPNDLFAMWLRKDDDSFSAGSSSSLHSREGIATTSPRIGTKKKSPPSAFSVAQIGSQTKLVENDEGSDDDTSEKDPTHTAKPPLSEQQLFSQWARGGDSFAHSSDRSFRGSASFGRAGRSNKKSDQSFFDNDGTFRPTNTFQRMPNVDRSDRDSDDGSVIDDEQKKQVGVNDHLSKAIALLEDDGQPLTNDVTTIEQSQVLLSQVDQDGTRRRPLTNYELTSGCVPLFGVEDAPLPQEADLGIHETREEQQRAQDQKRSQEIIEKFVAPNVFGCLACPNPAVGPDDFESWSSRIATSTTQAGLRFPSPGNVYNATGPEITTGSESSKKRQYNSYGSSPAKFEGVGIPPPEKRDGTRSRSAGNSVDLEITPNSQQLNEQQIQQNNTHRHTHRPPKHTGKRSNDSGISPSSAANKPYQRYGRPRTRFGWWNVAEEASVDSESTKPDEEETTDETILQIPPIHHSANSLNVSTKLEPSPEKLHADNLPLSTMHSATSMEQTLPYLSDRPHSYRYLQIDTQTIAFPPIKGEIEPLFCSLAIYNVETISSTSKTQTSGGASSASGSGNKTRSIPIPNLQRCGRVTEALYFDHVADDDVARKCSGSLYPYSTQSTARKDENDGNFEVQMSLSTEEVAEERSQGTRCGVFPIPSNQNVAHLYAVLVVRKVVSEEADVEPYYMAPKGSKSVTTDVEKHRLSAAKNSSQHGSFLMPFAFGVAPLLQVFGTENPLTPSSRAVQIPLFRFTDKESQIIDHIMVMLFPKASHKTMGIGAAPVTNGGTAMLVMRNFGYLGLHPVIDTKSSLARERLVDFTGEVQVRRKSEGESSENNLRLKPEQSDGYKVVLPDWHPQYVAEPTTNGGRYVYGDSLSTGKLYAQELLPLPLHVAPSSRSSPGTGRINFNNDDIEPFYNTSFCNELLCLPRIVHNGGKGNLVLKVELRELEWKNEVKGYLAHLPSCGPSIHNMRRGAYLVQSAVSSCSSRRSHQFMDEFKIRLPLDLRPMKRDGTTRNLSIVFTLYKIKLGTSSKGRWKRGAKLLFGSSSASDTTTFVDEHNVSGNTKLEQVSCGFLPINEQSCLIENGIHDVRIAYKACPISEEMITNGLGDSGSVVLKDCFEEVGMGNLHSSRENSCAEDTQSESSIRSLMFRGDVSENARSTAGEIETKIEDSPIRPTKGQHSSNDPISLSVRIVVFSSVHAQNVTLSDFLNQETDIPLLSQLPNKVFMSTLRMGRSYLANNTGIESNHNKFHSLDERLLESTIAITDNQLCSVSRSTGHILRILSRLWRTLICGNGEPNLAWANPGTSTALRVHSFATIVHLVGVTSQYLAKNGLTQLDGSRKWSVAVFGRIVALLFNEGTLFGSLAIEAFDEVYWSSPEAMNRATVKRNSPTKKALPKKRRHFRNNYDLFNDMPPRDIPKPTETIEIISSTAGDLASPPQKRALVPGLILSSDRLERFDDLVAAKEERKQVDSKLDFQQAFRAANAEADSDVHPSTSSIDSTTTAMAMNGMTVSEDDDPLVQTNHVLRGGASSGKAFVQAFGDVSGGSRRWMTAPTNILLTIPESDHGDDSDNELQGTDISQATNIVESQKNPQYTQKHDGNDEIVTGVTKQTKQMRRPRIPLKESTVDSDLPSATKDNDPSETPLLLTSEDEIFTKGSAFLDTIGASIGMSFNISNSNGEEQRVGSSHHRNKKTHSRSSIDWSLMSDNLTLPAPPVIQEENVAVDEIEEEEEAEQDDETMSTLKIENSSYIKLPSFIDRLLIIGKLSGDNSRWFPYAYEVIIMQWAAVLIEQKKSGESASGSAGIDNKELARAAHRSIGFTVANTPMLLEVIKQSIGFRLQTLFKQVLSKKNFTTPPLAVMDETLTSHLEQLISMVTDACLDSRNFDSWDLRDMSFDVNDAIIRFLRDMFAFLAPHCVHRLILTYFTRFVTKEGKHISDRDSLVGLRCSWEISKLRLNAVTALVRFPEFLRVNSPQMFNWKNWWASSPLRMSSKFYDDILDRYQTFRLPAFIGTEDSKSKNIAIPNLRPHWLAELVVDICLLGTEHAEQQIQHRSSSLLHELFWFCSQESILAGTCAPVASMFLTLVEKVVSNASYLANFSAKSQMRKDIMLCFLFVLQSAPTQLLRAVWRNLIVRMPGQDLERKYIIDFSLPDTMGDATETHPKLFNESKEEPNILGMFSVLNLALRTVEYEGCDSHLDCESSSESRDTLEIWHRENLLCRNKRSSKEIKDYRKSDEDNGQETELSSSISRKWQSHDGSMVIVNTGHHIVRELYVMLRNSPNGRYLLNPAVQFGRQSGDRLRNDSNISPKAKNFTMSKGETILFVRAATSLYLHALALRESDVVLVRTFLFSAEVIKMFGISIFLEAVGETLQHWMRVISFHCGARRAQVRIEATDLLELMLRSSWECFGSFFRIRVPLLAIQTEVMERIVAIAASRYYREQRKSESSFEPFNNLCAEASLVPLWRTLDRIQKQPASQNIAFRGALIRIAGKLKKLYRAYVAARVLSFIKGAKDKDHIDENDEQRDFEAESLVRATRINLIRVINASAGHSKQFLGFQGTSVQSSSVAHFEAVEDALIDAADVFSPTELPEHRVAWLRMLAEFHSGRKKCAEEATCHYQIHETLHLAAKLHGSLWSNTPFLPWTDNIPDPVVYIDGDATQTEPDCTSELFYDGNDEYGKRMDNANSFRRIFYRVANSIAVGNNEWDSGVSKNLFFGIAFPDEYYTVSPWISLREMEENMAEEVEAAGHLFLQSGIIESSRFAWNLATQLYAEKFNYAKLSNAYSNLAKTVVSQAPPIDTSLPHETLATLGRFYRVWFHGGAPDDLSGVEFVYRTQGDLLFKTFGEELRDVIKSIIPERTPICLMMDHGLMTEEKLDDGVTAFTGFSRIGSVPLEPVRIKVTPLRPLFETKTRGLPEWFSDYVDETYGPSHRPKNEISQRGGGRRRKESLNRNENDPHHHEHFRSFSATVFSSAGSVGTTLTGRRGPLSTVGNDKAVRFGTSNDSNLRGVDKFCFLQSRDRSKGPKEWLKSSSGDFAEKSLKVTQLQVAQSFPACVTRQAVVHRIVYAQSPLEAGVDAVCQWCAILFRTCVSTSGLAVLKTNSEPGLGNEAAKIVADCIHSSRVKDIGLALLKKDTDLIEGETSTDFTLDYGRLSEEEVRKLQKKLSRLIITFMELLHLLIVRNRDLLLNVIKERKKANDIFGNTTTVGGTGPSRGYARAPSLGYRTDGGMPRKKDSAHKRTNTDSNQSDNGMRSDARSNQNNVPAEDQQSYQSALTTPGVRTDSAIAVQSELQRAFIKLVKDLYPRIHGILQSDIPRWLKQCTVESYFSAGTYQQTKVLIAEELCFISFIEGSRSDSNGSRQRSESHLSHSDNGYDSPRGSIGGVSHTSGFSRGSLNDHYGINLP